MEFLKNHYEKVVLFVVLLLVAAAVAVLPMKVPAIAGADDTPAAQTKMEQVNLTTNQAVLEMINGLTQLNLGWPHNLFNPVIWEKKGKDKVLIKYNSPDEIGLGAMKVDKIDPLYFAIAYEDFKPTGAFQIGITQETNNNPALRSKSTRYVNRGQKDDSFTLLSFSEPAESPAEITVQLNDGQKVVIPKNKEFKFEAGYTADLSYTVGNSAPQRFQKRRAGDPSMGIFQLEGETNKIVDIRSNEVVVSSSSGKRVNLKYKAVP